MGFLGSFVQRWRRNSRSRPQSPSIECSLVSLLLSDVFPGLAVLLTPVDLSRLALTCRAGDAATGHAAVWWRSCALHYRFGQAHRQRVEVQIQARRCRQCQLNGVGEMRGQADDVALGRAWRQVGAGLWWHTRTPEEDPVEEVLQWMGRHRAARVSVPVGFQGIRSRWEEMMRPAKATAVWQREYRVIASLLHSINFVFPLISCSGTGHDGQVCSGAEERVESARGRQGLVDRLLSAAMVVHSQSCANGPATVGSEESFRVDDATVALAPNLRPLALRGGMRVFEHLVPSVTGIQHLLEEAYAEQFDPPGAAYFDGGQLVGKTKPIGATECAVILRYLGIRAMIFEMRSPSPASQTHESLMELCRFWFLSEHSCRFPLYLQYGVSDNEAGGSLLIVGIYSSGAFGVSQTGVVGVKSSVQPAASGVHADEEKTCEVGGQCQGCASMATGGQGAGAVSGEVGAGVWAAAPALAHESPGSEHVGVWENGTHQAWDTLLVLNPDAAATHATNLPPVHMVRTRGALVPWGNESIHSLEAAALDWAMVQVVGCGMGNEPLHLAAGERVAWRDLSVGLFRLPDEPLSWNPHALFGITPRFGS